MGVQNLLLEVSKQVKELKAENTQLRERLSEQEATSKRYQTRIDSREAARKVADSEISKQLQAVCAKMRQSEVTEVSERLNEIVDEVADSAMQTQIDDLHAKISKFPVEVSKQ